MSNYWIQKALISIHANYLMSKMWQQTSQHKPCKLYINAVGSESLQTNYESNSLINTCQKLGRLVNTWEAWVSLLLRNDSLDWFIDLLSTSRLIKLRIMDPPKNIIYSRYPKKTCVILALLSKQYTVWMKIQKFSFKVTITV